MTAGGKRTAHRRHGAEPVRALHPELDPAARSAQFREGLDLFERGEHFEAHERFEAIWRSNRPEPRDLIQGLVLVAAALHHFHVRRRPDVALRVLRRGTRRLASLAPHCCGLDLAALLDALEPWARHLAAGGSVEDAPPAPRIPIADAAAFG